MTTTNTTSKTPSSTQNRPKAGLMLIAAGIFRDRGTGTPRGSFHERMTPWVDQFNNTLGQEMDVVFPGVIYDQADLHRAMKQFQEEKVDFVVLQYLSWAPDSHWIEFLRDMTDVPILFAYIYPEKMSFTKIVTDDDFIELFCMSSLVGTLEATGSIKRVGTKNVTSVVGNFERVLGEIRRFGRAAAARSGLRRATIGLVGSFNPVMKSTYVDPYAIFTHLGPQIQFIGFSDLALEIAEISDADAKAYVARLRSQYQVMPDVDEVKFLESARASLALAQLAAKNNLQVMTLNDVDLALQRAIGLRPGFYPEWFFENRCPLLPEGEVAASIAAYMLQKVSDQHVNYMEPHCIDAEHDCFVAQHLGPNDYTDPVWAKRVQIATNTLNAKAACKYPGAAFGKYRFSPGLKTALHVSECRGTFKMVFTLLDSLDGDHFMEGYSHGIMRPHLPMDSFFEQLMEIGITQHFLIADGDWRPELRFLGKITGMEVHSIE